MSENSGKKKNESDFKFVFGREVTVTTKDNKVFEGIFFKFLEGYFYMILNHGIVTLFPRGSIKKMESAHRLLEGGV